MISRISASQKDKDPGGQIRNAAAAARQQPGILAPDEIGSLDPPKLESSRKINRHETQTQRTTFKLTVI